MKALEKIPIGTLVVQDTAVVGVPMYFELNFVPAYVKDPLQHTTTDPIVTRESNVQMYACEYDPCKINRAAANEMLELTYKVLEGLRNINIRKAILVYVAHSDMLDMTISCEAYQEPE